MSAERSPAVLDASVVAALYVEEELSPSASIAVGELQQAQEQLHAPDLLLHEVANVFAKAARRGVLDTDACLHHLDSLASSEIQFHDAGNLVPAAMSLALAHGISAYDAAYLALALRLGAKLLTADRRFAERARATGITLELIAA